MSISYGTRVYVEIMQETPKMRIRSARVGNRQGTESGTL